MKKLFSLIIHVSLCLSIYSQSISTFPTVIQPSPQVSNFERYGNIPEGNVSGVTNISIPLLTIKSGSFEMPVSLSYNASGIKLNDMSSWVGLGWSLMAGGYITRNIKDAPDTPTNRKVPPLGTVSMSNDADADSLLTELYRLPKDRDYDRQPDEFSFNFLGHSGKFVLDRYYGIQYKYENMRIMFLDTYFEIKMDNGYTYLFKEVESARYHVNVYGYQGVLEGTQNPFSYDPIVSWHLSTIITPTNDSIHFEYKHSTSYLGLMNWNFICIFGSHLDHNSYPDPNYSRYSYSIGFSDVDEVYLTKIIFRGGQVVFESTADRNDNPVGFKLNAIKMYNSESNMIKNINLSYNYFYSNKGYNTNSVVSDRYRLKLLRVSDTIPYDAKVHKFEYNTELLPPRFNCGIDLQGYYNGAESNVNTLYYPVELGGSVNDMGYARANRTPNLLKMQACALTTVYYPSKGFTKYEYENHVAKNVTEFVNVGGLRVKTIKNYDSDGIQFEGKEFKYGNNEDGSGIISPGYFKGNSAPYKTVEFFPVSPLGCSYVKNELTCIYDYPVSSSPYGGVLYPQVNEYLIDGNGRQLGKTTYKYDYTYDSPSSDQIVPITFYSDNSQLRGDLIEKSEYDNNNTILTKKTYNYDTYKRNTVWSLIVKWKYQLSAECMQNNSDRAYVNWSWVERDGFVKKLKSLRDVQYFGNDSIASTLDYSRDWKISTYLQFLGLTNEKTTTSTGKLLETVYTYPDLTTPNGILSPYFMPIIEQKKYSNSLLFEDIKVTYSYFNNLYLPSMVQLKNNELSAFRTEKEFHNYDSYGNPNYITLNDFSNVVYLWSYNGQYPIAEIKNATFQNITEHFDADYIEYMSKRTTPTNQDIFYINSLRNWLPNSQITTYTYNPSVGMLTKTQPNLIVTSYEYNSFNQLKYVKDNQSKIMQEFQYNYKK